MTDFRQRGISIFLLLMLGAGTLTLSGCDALSWIPGLGPQQPAEQHAPSGGEETEEEAATEEEEELSPEEKALALLPPAMQTLPYEEVSIVTPDQVVLYGRLYDPTQTGEETEEETDASAEEETDEATEAPKYPLVILLPGLNHTRLSWGDLPADLVQAGYAVFAMDLRGHGGSSRTKGGRRFSWRFFQGEHWEKMPGDIATVLRFFRKSEDYPQVNARELAFVGEKLGANVAIMAARSEKSTVKAMVLLSPGRSYKGLDPSHAALEYPGAVLVMAGNADEYSFQSAQVLYRIFGGAKSMDLYQDTDRLRVGSGSEILLNQPSAKVKIVDWLKKYLPATATAGPSGEAAAQP